MLPARLPVDTLARATVTACALAAAELTAVRGHRVGTLTLDAGTVATAFTSERHLRVDGRAFAGFAPLSRFWPTADGWLRTHANYPHHRARLLAALGADETAVGDRLAGLPATVAEDRITGTGGLAVAVRTPGQWTAHPAGAAVSGLLSLRRVADAPARPLPALPGGPLLPAAGVRVLDLTRVIAGPVATRTLALLGADVLRVDSPGLPEIDGQHLDTGFGKRSTLLDLADRRDRAVFDALLAGADVLVTGYRPGALERLGLGSAPVVARLGAWGPAGPWAGRRGFDSLVQAASGIAVLEAGPDGRPGALPAQALDHGTGYLLAAAVLRALARRAVEGGAWRADLSLAQTARWLLSLPPVTGAVEVDPAPHLTDTGALRHARPAFTLPGGPDTWAHAPGAWGTDPARWLEPAGRP